MTKVVQQSVDIWNDRWNGRREQTRKVDNHYNEFVNKMNENFANGREWSTNRNTKFADRIVEIYPKKGVYNYGYFHGSSLKVEDQEAVLTVPIVGKAYIFEFEIEVKVVLSIKNGIHLSFPEKTAIADFKCLTQEQDECDLAYNDLVNTFYQKLFPDLWFWDLPSSLRFIKGFARTFNEMEKAKSLVRFSDNSLQVFINCH